MTKCKEISLFLNGNDLNEEELNTIKTKFDCNLSYEKFYFQSYLIVNNKINLIYLILIWLTFEKNRERMIIIYDTTESDQYASYKSLY